MVVKGRNKSGRPWKDSKVRSGNLNASGASKKSFQKRMEAKKQKEIIQGLSSELMEDVKRRKEQERKRRAAVKKQKEDNALKTASVQEIKDKRKVKRMTKRQLIKSRVYLKGHAMDVLRKGDC
eukprot:TRINITY_DN1701_c8_g1_i1.p1 TRINITY_DN1701_c8_g1~~TRINITY_DN1701_c8_g1_i1.p1  ORF type:complete len:123 (+),score=58.40 TRINITY_DN1701_c8_g1_i1:82-450(+)